jgi:phage terminase small subunit
MPALANVRHEAFCQAMVRGATAGNFAASYAATYNNAKHPGVRNSAYRLNRRVEISRRIGELQAELQTIEAKATERAIEKLAITKERILAELARIGFANMQDYVQPTAAGDVVVNVSALSRDQAAAIQEVIVDYRTGGGEDSKDVKRVRLKLHDKRAALVDLGKHLGLFVERRHVTTEHIDKPTDELTARLGAIVVSLGSLGIDFGAVGGGVADRGRAAAPEAADQAPLLSALCQATGVSRRGP